MVLVCDLRHPISQSPEQESPRTQFFLNFLQSQCPPAPPSPPRLLVSPEVPMSGSCNPASRSLGLSHCRSHASLRSSLSADTQGTSEQGAIRLESQPLLSTAELRGKWPTLLPSRDKVQDMMKSISELREVHGVKAGLLVFSLML